MSERDNRMVWDGEPGHYEVWYLTLSHRATQTGFWIRYTLEAPTHNPPGGGPEGGPAYCQLWFARFDPRRPERTFGVSRRFPIDRLSPRGEPFSIGIGGSSVRDDGMDGELEGAGHTLRWNLKWAPSATTMPLLPSFAYKVPVDTRAVSPNVDLHATGEIVVDGETYRLDGEPGGQSHVWGRKHAYQWAWAHVNSFDREGAVLEALSVQLRRGQLILPNLSMFTLRLDGEELSFREPLWLPFTRSDYTAGHFHFRGESPTARVEGTLHCRPEDLILTEYVDPDGDPAFCHNTCCGDAEVEVQRRSPFFGRWRSQVELRSERLAHFEWGARAGDVVRVKKHHLPI